MLDKDAIHALQEAHGIHAAHGVLKVMSLDTPMLALPEHYQVMDMEKHLPQRTRYRGRMMTKSLDDFIAYCREHHAAGSGCFIDQDDMTALTLFNLGSHEAPGHGDFRALLKLDATAEYTALLQLNGTRQTQKELAEFMEDHAHAITCYDAAGDAMHTGKAVSAVRKVTIEARRREDHEEQNFKAQRSALESIEASSEDGMPAGFRFSCVPFNGLRERAFDLRLSILTGQDRPVLVARIKRLEAEQEDMGKELAGLLDEAFAETEISTYIGGFSL